MTGRRAADILGTLGEGHALLADRAYHPLTPATEMALRYGIGQLLV